MYLNNCPISDKREYGRWMRQAEATLLSAKRDVDARDYNWGCFKAQQAAEFAVKGLLYGIGISAVGHSILMLLGGIEGKGTNVDEIKDCALDRHYIPTRYVNAHVEGMPFEFYDHHTAEEAMACANKIVQFVKKVAVYG